MNINIKNLQNKKNLLAFSAGVDSSALYYILESYNIKFDIIMIDYNVREQSKEEVQYAIELSKKDNKKLFLKKAPKLKGSSFEKQARDFRYDFFDEIMESFHYDNLITAHQLDDKIEWFMMQFIKGAGTEELIGFSEISKRKKYNVIKPLLEITKKELEEYLIQNDFKYFIDESNSDEKYKRNEIRNILKNSFFFNNLSGMKKSLNYIENDIKENKYDFEITNIKELTIIKSSNSDLKDIRIIDQELKKRGIVISSSTREEIMKNKDFVVSHKYVVSYSENLIFIGPYIKNHILKKEEKERFRKNKIPVKIRSYISLNKIEI